MRLLLKRHVLKRGSHWWHYLFVCQWVCLAVYVTHALHCFCVGAYIRDALLAKCNSKFFDGNQALLVLDLSHRVGSRHALFFSHGCDCNYLFGSLPKWLQRRWLHLTVWSVVLVNIWSLIFHLIDQLFSTVVLFNDCDNLFALPNICDDQGCECRKPLSLYQ